MKRKILEVLQHLGKPFFSSNEIDQDFFSLICRKNVIDADPSLHLEKESRAQNNFCYRVKLISQLDEEA